MEEYDGLRAYMRSLPPPLTADRERELLAMGEPGRAEFIEHNLRLVVKCAWRFRGRGLAVGDLIQEGNIGLLHAVEKSDYRKGYRFSTYATWWINSTMRRAIQEQAHLIRLPVHIMEQISRVNKVFPEFWLLADDLTREDFAAASGLGLETAQAVLTALHPLQSLETVVGEGEDTYLREIIEDTEAESVEDVVGRRLEQAELRDRTDALLAELTERERTVLRLRFGLDGQGERSQSAVARSLGLSSQRVYQIEHTAIARLRETVAAFT